MRMGYNLQLEQTQKLVMTPQLQQAIKILQLNSIELEQFIQTQLETNPVLEVEEIYSKEDPLLSREREMKEIDWKEYADDYRNSGNDYGTSAYQSGENDFTYENFVSGTATLQEYLLEQYRLTIWNKHYSKVGEYLIYSLDENGYLNISLEEVAKEFNLGLEEVERVLRGIQTLDPPGVGARSLQECLLIQLDQKEITCPYTRAVIEHYLEDIAQNRYPQVAKKLNLPVEELQKICDFIRTLEPKPGRAFTSASHSYIVPDVVVKKVGDEYVIIMNEHQGPRLTIREDYRRILAGKDDQETLKYINDKLNAASWLIRSIEQRRQTIYKVVEKILEKQRGFFEQGKKHLRPMTLKEVAEEIEVHESTVSRATNGKYMETPVGTFELKYFFTSGIEGEDGEGVSAESIKSFIKEIIAEEDPKKPLSDNRIAEILSEKGMPISRRTVAKYREDLFIPASSKRKRY